MDIDFTLEVKHIWQHERPYKVTLTRGARGVYRWEIEVRGVQPHAVMKDAEAIDHDLQERYAAIPEGSQDPTES